MKIAMLVSGGVDSSVALALLKEQGHDVTAFYLKIWLEDELAFLGECPWEEDLSYVRAVCQQLDVPLEIISLQQEYWQHVVSYTVAEARAGRTPNPDILCNSRIKFGFFLDKIDSSFEKVATGHYAQLEHVEGVYYLKRAPDDIKDQTYFLSQLNQTQLERALFPIGHLIKDQVRTLAHHYNLPNKDRKDSQGICFLGKLKFRDFMRHHLGDNPGNFIDYETKAVVGTHQGYWFYTIGQRQGLGLAGGPWYVESKDIERNIVYLSREYHAQEKERDRLLVAPGTWHIERLRSVPNLQVKLRHGAHLYACAVELLGADGTVEIKLAERDQGIAAGQFAVFYEGSRCLGSGMIVRSL